MLLKDSTALNYIVEWSLVHPDKNGVRNPKQPPHPRLYLNVAGSCLRFLCEAVKKHARNSYLNSAMRTFFRSLNACRFVMARCVLDYPAGTGADARPSRIHCCTL